MLHDDVVKVTAWELTAATVGAASLGVNPVPVAVSVVGRVLLLGVNDQEGAAVNDVVEVGVFVPSLATNVCATFGAAVTVNEQVSVPCASVLHAPSVSWTAVGVVGEIVISWSATNPVPVAVSVRGSVLGPTGLNDHSGAAVNEVVDVTVFVPS